MVAAMNTTLRGWPVDLRCNTSKDSPIARTAIILRANSQVINDLRECAKNDSHVKLQTGRTPRLQYGSRSVDLTVVAEKFTHELYTSNGSDQLQYAATITQRATAVPVERHSQDVAGTDNALAALKQSLASFAQEKEAKQATISTSIIPSNKSNKILSNRYVPQSNQRSSGAAASPIPHHTSFATAPTSVPAADRDAAARNKAMIYVLSHYLSSGTKSDDDIRGATKIIVSKSLELVGKLAEQDVDSKRWKLKDKSYRDLDLWKFPFPASDDREAAVECAIRAFDRLRLSKEDKLWQSLLPEGERGKGKCLSRLHGNNHLAVIKDKKSPLGASSPQALSDGEARVNDGHLTPKPASSAMARTSSANGKPLSIEKRLKESQKQRAAEGAKAKKKDRATKQGDLDTPNAAATMKISQPAKKASPTKFKSAERVHDSDAESEGEIKVNGRPSSSATTKSRPGQVNARSPAGTSSSEGQPSKKSWTVQDRTSIPAVKANVGLTPSTIDTPKHSIMEARKLTPSQRAEKHGNTPGMSPKLVPESKKLASKPKDSSLPDRPDTPATSMFGTQGRSTPVVKKVISGTVTKGHRSNASMTSVGSAQKRPTSDNSNESDRPRKVSKMDVKVLNGKDERAPRTTQARAADSGPPLKRKANEMTVDDHDHDLYKRKHHRAESSSTQSLAFSMSSGASHTTTAQTSIASPSPPLRDQWITARSPSATSSTSGDPERRAWQQALDDAERFRKTLYPAYLKLYNRIKNMGPGEPKREDVEELYRMHDRLAEMKKGIRQAAHA